MGFSREPAGSRQQADSVAMTVVEAVAEAEEVDATALTPLSTVVDTDALDRLVRSSDGSATVEFPYRDWLVEIRSSGDVTLRER